MNTEPILAHMIAMLRQLEEDPLRVVYMVVRQLYEMQLSVKKE